MTREFDKEQEALESVERDMHGVANDVGATIKKAEQDGQAAAGTAAPDGAEGPQGEGTAAAAGAGSEEGSGDVASDREPWNVQMNKLFFRDKIEQGEMTPEGDKTAESPEDAYVAEREATEAADAPAAAAEEAEGAQPAEDAGGSRKNA